MLYNNAIPRYEVNHTLLKVYLSTCCRTSVKLRICTTYFCGLDENTYVKLHRHLIVDWLD